MATQASAGPEVAHVSPGRILDFIRALLSSANLVKVVTNDVTEGMAFPRLVAESKATLCVAAEIMGLVSNYYESSVGEPLARGSLPPGDAVCAEVDGRPESAGSAGDIADMAFVARLALSTHLKVIGALEQATPDRWEVVTVVGSAYKEVLRSLTAVQAAISCKECLPCNNALYETELENSLRIRRAYLQLWQALSESGEPTKVTLGMRLRMADSILRNLASQEVYSTMRVMDRMTLEKFHGQILEWLRSGESPAKAVSGDRLWCDLMGAVELLLSINDRTELKEHDQVVLRETLEALGRIGDDAPLPVAVRTRLESLLGRDRELDRLIQDLGDPPARAWLPVIQRVATLLGPVATFARPEPRRQHVPRRPPAPARKELADGMA